MARQTYNQESDFDISGDAVWDSGIKLTGTYPVSLYWCQESSGSVLTNELGTDGVIGSNFNYQDAGPLVDTYALSSPANDYCTLTGLTVGSDVTLRFWFRPTAGDIATGHSGVFGDFSPRAFAGYMASGVLTVEASSDGSQQLGRKLVSGTLTQDTWYHIQVVITASGSSLSIDGVEVDTASGGAINSFDDFNFGRYSGYAVGVTGRYADISIYDTALSSTYTNPTALTPSKPEAEAIITGDAGAGKAFDLSEALDASTGSPVITYQSTDDVGATNYVPVTPETLAELQSRSDTEFQNTKFKIFLTGDAGDIYTEFSCDVYTTDITPPVDVSAEASSATPGASSKFDLIATFTGGTDAGAGYAGANFEIERSSTSYFQQINGTFSTSEIFANLLLAGDASAREICYSLNEDDIPTRYRINAWDVVGNYNRGEWQTFLETDADNVISSAGGNWVDDDLADQTDFTANVRVGVEGGVGFTGGFSGGVVPTMPTVTIADKRDNTGVTGT